MYFLRKFFYHHIKNNDTTQLGKKKMIDKEDVFQISYLKTSSQNNKIVQVYQQDSLEENYLSIPEMNEYLAGRQQAYKNYKSFKYAALGFVGGLGSGYLGPFWGFLPVSVYTGVSGLWSIKTFYKADHPEDFNSPFFTEGYRQVTYSKQVKNSAIGSLAGLAISIATFQLILR